MRLFVGVRPPEGVLDEVAALVERLDAEESAARLRWTGRDTWHVTLRFFGEVADPEPVVAALDTGSFPAVEATLGSGPRVLGRQVLCLPVAGLEKLAAAVGAATSSLGAPPPDRPFHGHLTLARARGRRNLRRRDGGAEARAGMVATASWRVDEIVLVRSQLSADGPRYQDLHVVRLGR